MFIGAALKIVSYISANMVPTAAVKTIVMKAVRIINPGIK
jgi:hypothetical protein